MAATVADAAAPAPAAPPAQPAKARAVTQRSRIQCKQQIIVTWLQEFFAQPGHLERILPLVDPESAVKSPVSLRLVDWFCTNYAKKNNVAYLLDQRQFLVYFQYKRELKAYSKRMFDPFCRRERISFQARGHKAIETTIGQLNFFRWALEKGVLAFVEANREAVEADMNKSIKEHYGRAGAPGESASTTPSSTGSAASASAASTASAASAASAGAGSASGASSGLSASGTRSSSGRRRRSELSKSAMKMVNHHATNVVVTFD
jgi:hypothetical protein